MEGVTLVRVVDRTGQRFGRLLVIERVANDKYGRARWLCRCDCGGEKIVKSGNLRSGVSSSCGCFRRERARKLAKSMAGAKSPVWKGGYDGAYCRCQRSLTESKKKGKKLGYAPCNATVEDLVPTVTNKCQMCGAPEMEMDRRLSLDHDHTTGEFRGWLCDRCNKLVGMVEAYRGAVEAYLAGTITNLK